MSGSNGKSKSEFGYEYIATIAGLMMHPLRLIILMEIGAAASPTNPTVIAKKNNAPVNDVAYHVRKLARFDAIALAATESVRGATKHLYVIAPLGEDILTWARKMERYGRQKARERAAEEAALSADHAS